MNLAKLTKRILILAALASHSAFAARSIVCKAADGSRFEIFQQDGFPQVILGAPSEPDAQVSAEIQETTPRVKRVFSFDSPVEKSGMCDEEYGRNHSVAVEFRYTHFELSFNLRSPKSSSLLRTEMRKEMPSWLPGCGFSGMLSSLYYYRAVQIETVDLDCSGY